MPSYRLKDHARFVTAAALAGDEQAAADLRAAERAREKQEKRQEREARQAVAQREPEDYERELERIKATSLYRAIYLAADDNGRAILEAIVRLSFQRGIGLGADAAAKVCRSLPAPTAGV